MNFSNVKTLVLKEVKDLLRDPRIIIPFILSAAIMPVVGFMIFSAMQIAARQVMVEARTIAVLDLDRSATSLELVEWLSRSGAYTVKLLNVSLEANYSVLVREAFKLDVSTLVIVERGFEKGLFSESRPKVHIISLVKEFGIFSAAGGMAIVGTLKDFAARKLVEGRGLDYQIVRDPLRVEETTYIAPKEIFLEDPSLLVAASMASLLIPLILISVALVVMQMAATSMAVENEERTLETLLTLPVSNYEVLISKLFGMFVVSMIGTVFEVAGMAVYFFLLIQLPAQLAQTPGQTSSAFQLPLFVNPSDLAYITLSLLLALFFAAALGLVVGALSRDVRIANTIVGPLSMLFYLPGMFIVFVPSKALGDLGALLLYTMPVTQPVIAAKDAVGARLPLEMPMYLILSLVVSLLTVYAASKLFSLEVLSSLQYKLSTFIHRRGRRSGERG